VDSDSAYGCPERISSDQGGEFTAEDICKELKTIQLEYNMTRHSTTRETPFYLVFGQDPRLPQDKLGRPFQEGDQVLIRKEPVTNKDIDEFKKLMSPWSGPYTVAKHDKVKYPNTLSS